MSRLTLDCVPVALIGSHATVTGGLATGGLAYASAVEAEVIQVFVSNPRGWAASAGDPVQDAKFRESEIPVFIHAPYLINFGSGDSATANRSAEAIAHAMRRGKEIGARGVVVHTGSAVGAPRDVAMRQVSALLVPVLDALGEDDPDLLLEPMAGQGQMLCASAADLGPYLAALGDHPKAGICLDTCHLFAAGHDLTAPDGVASTLSEVEQAAGTGRVKLVHANDSLLGCGSKRDRHESIGEGAIGAEPFRELLAHPSLANVPFVVETPGGKAGHARDIAALKELRASAY
ncbi:MAG: deoxyribonuclease IV [Trebonia sp.]